MMQNNSLFFFFRQSVLGRANVGRNKIILRKNHLVSNDIYKINTQECIPRFLIRVC